MTNYLLSHHLKQYFRWWLFLKNMKNNLFNRVNSKHGNIKIDVDANGNIVLSQQSGSGKIILTSDEAGNLGELHLRQDKNDFTSAESAK